VTTSNANRLYTQQRFLFMTIDPVHIGAGGYRLGRVDMTITREPGTSLPKIPGTSIAGATRSYAAMRYGKPDVAGQHKEFTRNNKVEKGKEKEISCPIIYTFGTATDTSESERVQGGGGGITHAGTVSIGDAHILFFPVSSMAGPVWVSTADRVKDAWGEASVQLPEDMEPTGEQVVTSLNWNKELNLGWLLFGTKAGLTITPPDKVGSPLEWSAIKGRIVLVDIKLFSQIVNSNLEVRTSVSIDPATGAAESGALFTYEALPRATWLWSDVIEDDYHFDDNGKTRFPLTERQCKIDYETEGNQKRKIYKDNGGESLGETWSRPLDVVRAGVTLIEYLGIGGMGTRGFGRVRCVKDWDVTNGGMR
jgi:CRISPR-associated protein Cmr4